MKRKEPDPNCFDCDGSGRLTIPAHIEVGILIEEATFDCHCTGERSQEDESYVDE